MAATFTRTNQFILGQGVMLIVGDLVIDTAPQTVTAAELGVKKIIAVLGACINGEGGASLPVLDAAGGVMSEARGHDLNLDPDNITTFEVDTYSRLAFLAV